MSNRRLGPPLLAAKNLLRPFGNSRKNLPRWKQFQQIRTSTGVESLSSLCQLMESSKFYRFPGLGNTFPFDFRQIPDPALRNLEPLSLARELRIQIARLTHHHVTLSNALVSLADINTAITESRWTDAASLLSLHSERFGLSFVAAKKELLVALHQDSLSGFSRRYKALTTNAERYAWGLQCRALYDLTDPAFHPGEAARRWLRILNSRLPDADWYAYAIISDILTAFNSKSQLANAVLRIGSVSLLDLMLLIWKTIHIHSQWPEVSGSQHYIHQDLIDILNTRFNFNAISIPPRYDLTGTASSDAEVYRLSFLFSEVAQVALWRARTNVLLFPTELNSFRSTSTETSPLKDAVIAVGEVEGLAKSRQALQIWLATFLKPGIKIAEPGFTSALAIAEYLRSLSADDRIQVTSLIDMISLSHSLHLYLDQKSLSALLEIDAVRSNALLDFILRELIYRRTRGPDAELDRRAAFMAMFPDGEPNDIISFLSSVSEWSPRASELIARLCTRTFLERLYLLMSSVKDVLETRINICRWLLDHNTDAEEALIEERAALERELANLDARSDLDSTRIHVDEESLREWFVATQHASAARYVQTVLAEGVASNHGTFLAFYNKLREQTTTKENETDFFADTQIGSEFIFLEIFEAMLEVFLTDRTFGLDSYLSRRIRHGTLIGFLMTPISRIINRVEALAATKNGRSDQTDIEAVLQFLRNWQHIVAAGLEHARREIIQVRSLRHPLGLIEATWRTTSNVTHLDAMMYQARKRVIELRGDYDVFVDLYSLCWDMLERDLSRLRLYMLQDFYRNAMDKATEAETSLSLEQRYLLAPYMKDASAAFLSRVMEVCGWFIRPVFRRNSYGLRTLVYSTLSIVRELDASYLFQELVDVDESVSVNRGGFEVIGDVLFVLVANAAKHGKRGGSVKVSAIRDGLLTTMIELRVSSEVEDAEALSVARSRITEAVRPVGTTLLEDAAVGEGFSGLRKIIGLVKRIRSSEVRFYWSSEEEKLTITFVLRVPAAISFGRERT